MSNIPFFQSPAFWILIGCFIGGFVGIIGMAILCASGRASLDAENMELRIKLERVKESLAKCMAAKIKRQGSDE